MNREERFEQWKQRIEEYRSSRQTQKSWCEENQISLTTFRYWHRRIRDVEQLEAYDDSGVLFARLPSESELIQNEDAAPPIVLNVHGIRIELYPSCSREMMTHLMSAIRTANV